jgi:selenocysteine lyase/cysteine desulfurase
VEWLAERGVDVVHRDESALKRRLWDALDAVPGVRMHGPLHGEGGAAIVTITIDGLDPAEAALRLDRELGVLVRAGLHCAPESHAILGTAGTGAVRFSVGWATTEAEVDRAAAAVARIAETKGSGRG